MTSLDWRSDKDLVLKAHAILNSEEMSEMLKIVESESPNGLFMPLIGSNDGDKIALFGRKTGYDEALAKLRSLATLQPETIHLESTFEPEHSFTAPIN